MSERLLGRCGHVIADDGYPCQPCEASQQEHAESWKIAYLALLDEEIQVLKQKLVVAMTALEELECGSTCDSGSGEGCDLRCRVIARQALDRLSFIGVNYQPPASTRTDQRKEAGTP